MKRLLIVFLLIIATKVTAQTGVITGKTVDAQSLQPIFGASVFLSNATKGTQTDNAGNFTLSNIKAGQYDLIVTYIGYSTYSYHVVINNDKQDVQVKLEKKPINLKEVMIGPDKNWQQNYERFKREFIGYSTNAPLCKIVNPKVLTFFYDKKDQVLEASTDEFLIIENRGLGYRLKYLLKDFNRNYITGMLYYEGQTLFEDLPGSNAQVKRWMKNRDKAYYGSSMHFYRALSQVIAERDGFMLHRLVRKDNPTRLPDSLIQAKIKYFTANSRSLITNDSLTYWNRQARVPRQMDMLMKDTVRGYDVAKRTQIPNIFALSFKDYLYVVYTKSRIDTYSSVYRPLELTNYPVSIIALKEPYALFDTNGIIVNPKSTIYEGEWTQGIAELLPYDFEPSEKQ